MSSSSQPGLKSKDLNDDLFSKIARGCGLKLLSWKPMCKQTENPEVNGMTCLLSAVLTNDGDRVSGLNFFEISGTNLNREDGQVITKGVVMKVKVSQDELLESLSGLMTETYDISQTEIMDSMGGGFGGAIDQAKEVMVAKW